MPENWLHSYLIESVDRNVCVKIGCTTCGAEEFRSELWRAAGSVGPTRSGAIWIAQAFGETRPRRDKEQVEVAARLVVAELCQQLGEGGAARALSRGWGADVLRSMQDHARAAEHRWQYAQVVTEVQQRAKRERKRAAQERHQQRLADKEKRDRVRRDSGEADREGASLGVRLLAKRQALDGGANEASGVYAFFIDDPAELNGITAPAQPQYGDALVYIGMTCPGQTGSVRDHVDCPHSGGSTFRRSLGAILKHMLAPRLKAMPRGPGASPTNWRNYRFQEEGEAALTRWMKTHLRMHFVPLIGRRDAVRSQEKKLIAELKPPLNLTDWLNPQAKIIKSLRSACAKEARDRGRPER